MALMVWNAAFVQWCVFSNLEISLTFIPSASSGLSAKNELSGVNMCEYRRLHGRIMTHKHFFFPEIIVSKMLKHYLQTLLSHLKIVV